MKNSNGSQRRENSKSLDKLYHAFQKYEDNHAESMHHKLNKYFLNSINDKKYWDSICNMIKL